MTYDELQRSQTPLTVQWTDKDGTHTGVVLNFDAKVPELRQAFSFLGGDTRVPDPLMATVELSDGSRKQVAIKRLKKA